MNMDNIGAEVGQKMRSAIKAKLMELGCYVDDELPDYIMVMVANKRTTSQMNEDLQLFLTTKTSTFVDWLQIVLKKLKEITVTNPDIYKRVSKRKSDEQINIKVKKEKKEKLKAIKKAKKKDEKSIKTNVCIKSLTDDLPVQASKLSEMRKIVVMQENQNSNSNLETVNEDCFDIPPLSEVAISNEHELEEIEEKIKNVKSRLGLQVESESEDEDFINIKAEPEDLFPNEQNHEAKQRRREENVARKIQLIRSSDSSEDQVHVDNRKEYFETDSIEPPTTKSKTEHPRIIFGNETADTSKKLSALERLGKKPNSNELDECNSQQHKKINLITVRKQEEQLLGSSRISKELLRNKNDENDLKKTVSSKVLTAPRESALKRLGVMSKVAVPSKSDVEPEQEEEEVINKEVPSVIKVKPRVMPPSNNQANKNLLLKAVAEAQRSIAQTPVVGNNAKPDALFTKKFRENLSKRTTNSGRKLSDKEKSKIKNILVKVDNKDKKELSFSSDDDSLEYVPKPLKKVRRSSERLEYIPSSKELSDEFIDSSDVDSVTLPKKSSGQTFIITLDGISRQQDKNTSKKTAHTELVKTKNSEEKKRKSPSPIIFDKGNTTISNTKVKQIPDKLPLIVSPTALKTKDRCKYWPGCRQGEKCEFIHPSTSCKSFPQCKFGEKCLYIHPMCKFETSCTKKDCPYSHVSRTFSSVQSTGTTQLCKFYPNCSNIHCMFYHPRPCKYGKYCKNQLECSFAHNFATKQNLTWRSTVKL